jgi:hypothetical protein
MAPDAPQPTYDSKGNMVAQWTLRVAYDSVRDQLTLDWSQEAGPYHKAKRVSNTYDPRNLEDAIADIQRAMRILGARRLF